MSSGPAYRGRSDHDSSKGLGRGRTCGRWLWLGLTAAVGKASGRRRRARAGSSRGTRRRVVGCRRDAGDRSGEAWLQVFPPSLEPPADSGFGSRGSGSRHGRRPTGSRSTYRDATCSWTVRRTQRSTAAARRSGTGSSGRCGRARRVAFGSPRAGSSRRRRAASRSRRGSRAGRPGRSLAASGRSPSPSPSSSQSSPDGSVGR